MYASHPVLQFASILELTSGKQRQPSTLNAPKRIYGGGIARVPSSSNTGQQSLIPALFRNDDAVDECTKRRSLLPQPSSVKPSFVVEPTGHGEKDQGVKAMLGWARPGGELPKGSPLAEEPADPVLAPQMPLSATAFKADGPTANQTMATKTTAPAIAVKRSQSLRKPTNFDYVRKPELRGHSRNASAFVKPNGCNVPVAHRRQMSHLPSSAHSLPRPKPRSTDNSRPTSAASTGGSVLCNISTRWKTNSASNRKGGVCPTGLKESPSTAAKRLASRDQTTPDPEQSHSQRSSLDTATSKSSGNNRARPAFTTLQQHYTPKKTAKAPTLSMIAASPTKITNTNVLPAAMIRLQTELLQLHLLHRTSVEVQRQWEHSAESTLRGQYEDVVERYRALRFKQSKAQERADLEALREWAASQAGCSFPEKIELLSRTLRDLGNIHSAGGKFAHVVTTFEQWMVLSERVKQLGQRTTANDVQDLEFLESLGEGWRSEVSALEMRLASRALDLKRLGQPLEGSCLAYLVGVSTTLVKQTLEELKIMREIEGEVLAVEAIWLKTTIDSIESEDGGEPENADLVIRKGVWRTRVENAMSKQNDH